MNLSLYRATDIAITATGFYWIVLVWGHLYTYSTNWLVPSLVTSMAIEVADQTALVAGLLVFLLTLRGKQS